MTILSCIDDVILVVVVNVVSNVLDGGLVIGTNLSLIGISILEDDWAELFADNTGMLFWQDSSSRQSPMMSSRHCRNRVAITSLVALLSGQKLVAAVIEDS